MIVVGRLAVLAWAFGMAYVAMKLVTGQGAVAMAALEAGRLSEAIMQLTFVTLVAVGTSIGVALFLFVGVFSESAR